MPNKKKNIILSILGTTLILIMLIGATYAYFQSQIKDGASSEVAIDTDTVDILTFNATDDIKLEATQETFGREKGNISGTTTLNAHLIANSTTQSATYKYNVYLDITKNNFVYSKNSSTPEIVLVIKNPSGQYVTTNNDKIGKITKVDLNGEQVTGYDITTKIGLVEISIDYLIEATQSTEGIADQNWEISVVLVNLDSNQLANAGKSFKAEAKVQSEKINILNLGGQNDYYKSTSSSSNYRDKIKNVYFVNYIASEEELNSIATNANWDLSSLKDKSIMGWLKANNEDESVPYDLYIGSNLKEGEKIIVRSFADAFYEMRGLETIDLNLDILDTSNLNVTNSMFHYNPKLTTITGIEELNVSNVTDMSQMFYYASGITELDLSKWNTINVTDMSNMFGGCSLLTTITGIEEFAVSNVINMSDTFHNTKLTTLDLSDWDTHNVTNMSYMFSGTQKLTTLDLSNWDTHNVTDISYMFYYTPKLTTITGIENLDASNVINMSNMFGEPVTVTAGSLITLNLSNWDTSNVTDMSNMFYYSASLKELDLSNWDTHNVTDMSNMFGGCSLLTTITGIEEFAVSNVINMSDTFHNTKLTTLDLSKWDTHNVTNMSGMFSRSSNLTSIDMRKATFSQITSYSDMFQYTNYNLKVTITGDANKNWFIDNGVLTEDHLDFLSS